MNSPTWSSESEYATVADQRTHDMQPVEDIVEYLKCYAREKPEVAALWCLGLGFILGWKLKPW